MMENDNFQPAAPAAQPDGGDPLQNQGCLSELGYLGAGLALPAASLGFYRVATRRKTILAILLFLLIGTITTVLITLSASRAIYSVLEDIQASYDQGSIPVITIQDGIASVDGPQPVIFGSGDSKTLLAVDTTGKLTEIDTSRYDSGFLMTRTELHVYTQSDRYQRLPLSTLNEMFASNPLVIDRQSVTTLWAGMSTVASALIFLFVLLWTTVIRLGYIALLALPIWGLASLLRSNTSFNTVLITGLVASIPAQYLVYLLEQANISFLFMGTLVELALWLVFLVLVLSRMDRPLPAWQDLKPWRALIALPALSFFGLNTLFDIPYGGVISWVLALITVLAIIAVGVFAGPELTGGGKIEGPLP